MNARVNAPVNTDCSSPDIGLAERLPAQPHTLGVGDHERGRWS